jgi:hypothetical protein
VSRYEVISKERYHMYALGEVVTRIGHAYNFILDGYEYVNEKGIKQYLADREVKSLDTKEKLA